MSERDTGRSGHLADNIPGAKLVVVKDVGHFHQLEKPLEFNATLKEFIGTLR